MRFADVIGQEEVKAMLRRKCRGGGVSHAQLFTGDSSRGNAAPRVGLYVQYINCTDRHDGDSCGRCPSCIKDGGNWFIRTCISSSLPILPGAVRRNP